MMIKSATLKLSCTGKLLSICGCPLQGALCDQSSDARWDPWSAGVVLLLHAPCVRGSYVWKGSCVCRTVPGMAAGAGLQNWVAAAACLRGQLVPMVWSVGQVDFSTGIVLLVAIISMCSFLPFPPLTVKKKSPGSGGSQICYCKQAVISSSKARSKNFAGPEKYRKGYACH